MRNFLLYVAGACGIIYLAVLYNSRGLLALGAVLFLVSPVFLYALQHVGHGLECALSFSPSPNQAGKYMVCLEVENQSALPAPSLRAKALLKQAATGRTCKVRLRGKAGAGQSVRLEGEVGRLDFGLWQIECDFLDCYDWLGLYRFRKKLVQRQQATLFPACYKATVKAGLRTRLFMSDSDVYHPQIGGDDPTEIFKLREYQKGDRPSHIHWKLSAKSDSLIVAEMGLPIGCNVVFFLDAEAEKMDRDPWAAFWEVVNTVSQEMLRQECAHYLVWYGKKDQRLHRKAIRSLEDLMGFWGEALGFNMGRCDFTKAYGSQFKGEAYASEISWSQELELSCNGKLLARITPADVEKQLLETELVL